MECPEDGDEGLSIGTTPGLRQSCELRHAVRQKLLSFNHHRVELFLNGFPNCAPDHGDACNDPRPRAFPALHRALSKRGDSGALRQSIVGFCTTLLPILISTLRPSQPKPVVIHRSASRRSSSRRIACALLDETCLRTRSCHRSRATGIASRHCGGQVSEFARRSGSVRPPIAGWTCSARPRRPRRRCKWVTARKNRQYVARG